MSPFRSVHYLFFYEMLSLWIPHLALLSSPKLTCLQNTADPLPDSSALFFFFLGLGVEAQPCISYEQRGFAIECHWSDILGHSGQWLLCVLQILLPCQRRQSWKDPGFAGVLKGFGEEHRRCQCHSACRCKGRPRRSHDVTRRSARGSLQTEEEEGGRSLSAQTFASAPQGSVSAAP